MRCNFSQLTILKSRQNVIVVTLSVCSGERIGVTTNNCRDCGRSSCHNSALPNVKSLARNVFQMGVERTELFGADEGYQCGLGEELRRVARTELREDDNTRVHALQQMRDWISKHPHIRKCRTGE